MSDFESKVGCVIIALPVVGLALLVGQCRSCSKKKDSVRQQKADAAQVVEQTKRMDALTVEIQSFLKDYAPSLAVKREETVRAIEDARVTRGKLSAKIDKYPTEEAKAIFREKVGRYDRMIRSLNKLLTTIDHEATTALANREAREIEGGGIEGMDSEALIDSAESILKQAALLKSDSDATPGDGSRTKAKPESPTSVNDDAAESPPATPAPKEDSLFEKTLKQAEKLAEQVRRATETNGDPSGDETAKADPLPVPPPKPKQPSPPKPKAPVKPSTPPIDRAAIEKEIRSLNAAIATHEDNLNRAWARVREITKNHTVPVVRGSRQHQEIQAIQRAIETSEEQLPGLKNRRDELKAKLEGR